MASEPPTNALRLSIDINVWVAALMATQHGRTGTVAQAIVAAVRDMKIADRPVQLVVSLEMADTLERVLTRIGFAGPIAHDFANSIVELMKAGPDQLDPYLLVSGRDQLGMHDREDAGVLATAIAARADVLVTDNLRDFQTNDSEIINTRTVQSNGIVRQIFCIIHERGDGVSLVVAHPVDVIAWLREGHEITPDTVRRLYRA